MLFAFAYNKNKFTLCEMWEITSMKRIAVLALIVFALSACSKGNTSPSKTDSQQNKSSSVAEKLGVPLPYDIDKTGCINRFYADEKNSEDIVIPASYSIDKDGKIVSGYAYQVVKISESCFANSNLTKTIVIPNTVTEIGTSAFYNCPNLEKINIPSSVTAIGDKAFDKCPKLTKLSYQEDDNAIVLSENDNLSSFAIPDSIVTIGNDVFANWDKLYTLTINENVNYVGDRCANNCPKLYKVDVEGVLYNFGDGSFQKCPKLVNLTFEQTQKIRKYAVPESITTIPDRAFYDWDYLEEIYLHKDITMKTNIFANNKNLKKIVCPNTTVYLLFYYDYSNSFDEEDYYAYKRNSGYSDYRYYQIPKTIREVELLTGNTVETSCFGGMSSLEKVTLAPTIRSFSNGSFYGLTNLKTVTLQTNYSWTYMYSGYNQSDYGTISKETMNSPTGLASAIKQHFNNSEYHWYANDGQ